MGSAIVIIQHVTVLSVVGVASVWVINRAIDKFMDSIQRFF